LTVTTGAGTEDIAAEGPSKLYVQLFSERWGALSVLGNDLRLANNLRLESRCNNNGGGGIQGVGVNREIPFSLNYLKRM
jgi:hypothetical protein